MSSLVSPAKGRVGAPRAGLWRRIAVLMALLGPAMASAQSDEAAEVGAPTLTAHSNLSFAAYKGSLVTVEAQAHGESLTYKWLKGNQTICRTATCELDTSDWSLGSHQLTLVVFNDLGSLFVKGRARVLNAPVGLRPGKVRAPLVEMSATIEAVAADDLVVVSAKGRGFSYHGRKVQVVGPTPRALEWKEKLRTQSASALRFGREGMEEHTLGERSSVYLVKGATERRALVLRQGLLRSRQLGGSPQWSIVIDPWLQIDTDDLGDVLVERQVAKEAKGGKKTKTETVTVTVLRGSARVYRWTDDAGHAGNALAVPQGMEVRLQREDDGTPVALVQPDAQRIQRHFQETTPQLLPGGTPAQWGAGWTLSGKGRPSSFGEARRVAAQALAAGDNIRVLEALAPFKSEMDGDYEASLSLGRAAVGLSLLDTAMQTLDQAVNLDPRAPEPRFLMGYVALAGSQWDAAVRHFEAASILGHPQEQEVQYYLGVARLKRGQRLLARSSFTYSLWERGKPEIEASARTFAEETRAAAWLEVRFGAGVFQDGNVFRSDTVDVATLGDGTIKENESMGYLGSTGFTAYVLRRPSSFVLVEYDFERRQYSDASLQALTRMDQRLTFGFGVAFQPYLALGLDAYAMTTSIGDERSMDGVGTELSLTSPKLLGLALRIQSDLHVDPLPGRDDLLDPLTNEIVAVGDRSSRLRGYGVGFTPLETARWRASLRADSRVVAMHDKLAAADNRNDLELGLSLRFAPSSRQAFGLALAQRASTYPDAEDDRKDSYLRVGGEWRWYFTPVLYQMVEAAQETQTSSREVNDYGRQTVGLRLGLEF